MLRLFIPCWIAFAPLGLNAQLQIAGTVLGEGDAPLAGANVVLGGDLAFGGATDTQGHFTIRGLRPGDLRLRVSMVGYQRIDTVIVAMEGMPDLLIRLSPDVIAMRAAEVTALRASERSPFARTTLDREQIDRINTGVDLPYLLEQQPGVVSTSDGGTGIGYTYMRIRGTDATRTNITVNGVPFNDPESQGAFLVNMPDLATSAEDIEVQRGVGASTNGPAAFGASVNIRTTAVKRAPWGLLSASGGSFGTQRYSASAGTGLINGRFSLDARLSSIATDGYVDRASADLKSYFLQGAWIGAKRSLRFVHFRGKEVTYQAWGGVPREVIDTNRTFNPYTYENEVDHYDQAHHQLLFDQRLGANATMNLTLFRVDGTGYFEQFREADELVNYGIAPAIINGDTVSTSDLIRRRWLDNTLMGANLSADLKLGAHRLLLGGSYSDYQGQHFGELIWARYAGTTSIGDRYYDNEASKTDANAFAKLTYAVRNGIDLFGDVQMRHVTHRLEMLNDDFTPADQTISFTFFNPKAGVLWRVHDGGRAYASIAVGQREPNREDLLETTPASRPKSERLIDYELGYDRRSGRLSAGINLYYMDYTDQLVLTGELNDVGAALRTNVPRSYRAGVELMGAVQVGRRITWRANATLSRNRITAFTEYIDDWDNGGQQAFTYEEGTLAFSPAVIAGSEMALRIWNSVERGNADLTFVTKYVGEQYLDNSASADRRLDAFVVNDLRANVTLLAKGTRGIDFNLTVRNLFSELYESNGWVYSYQADGRRQEFVGLYPQAPVNVLGGFTIRF
ncbi:MAG: TonB-dependent receptor [Flavobacteriales bacterium]|nr:TonB-dependent receptor [Flavobacteriales bacterium]